MITEKDDGPMIRAHRYNVIQYAGTIGLRLVEP